MFYSAENEMDPANKEAHFSDWALAQPWCRFVWVSNLK